MDNLKNYTCEICGGDLRELGGGRFICPYCKTEFYKETSLPDELILDLHSADRARSLQRFEDALNEYDRIIKSYPSCFDAYWGACLSDYGIQYEKDYDGKMLPTVHRYSEISVQKNSYYLNAVKYCTDERESERIKTAAAEIERIRAEIKKTISSQAPYDIFLCYKETPVGKTDGYTSEYHWAAELYGKLQGKGYRVFFAKESLPASKGDFEAHIFPALKSAKLMLILTTSAENVESVWVKNEWSRFLRFSKESPSEGKRFKVILGGMKPENLPRELRKEQALNHDSMGWVEQLYAVIADTFKDVKAEKNAQKASRLDKIEIKGGEISKRASTLSNETLTVRDVGSGASASTSVTEKQQLQLVNFYMQNNRWEDAKKLVGDILSSSPASAEALWLSLMIKYRAINEGELLGRLNYFTKEDFSVLERLLSTAEKTFAAERLEALYKAGVNVNDAAYTEILKIILPFNFSGRDKLIKVAFKDAIEKSHYEVFKLLLTTLDSTDVDSYIKYNLDFANNSSDSQQKRLCAESVLKVEEGNPDALSVLFCIQWYTHKCAELISSLEKILKYSKNVKIKTREILDFACKNLYTAEQCRFIMEALKYYPGELSEIEQSLMAIADTMIARTFFADAEAILQLVIEFSPENPEVYRRILLIKTGSRHEDEIPKSKVKLKDLPEYTKYMTLVGERERQHCIELVGLQDAESAANKKKKAGKRAIAIAAAIISGIVVFTIVLTMVIIPKLQYDEAMSLYNEGRYEEAIAAFKEIINQTSDDQFDEEIGLCYKAIYGDDIVVERDSVFFTVDSSGTLDKKSGAKLPSDLVIPEILDGKEVKYIANNAFSGTDIVTAKLPKTLVSLEGYQFTNCGNLISVTIPNTVTSVSKTAFEGSDGVIENADGLYYVGNWVIDSDRTVESVVLRPDTVGVGISAFYERQQLKSITFPDSLMYIAYESFYNCDRLTAVALGNGVKRIASRAFYHCQSITAVTIPDSIEHIGASVFNYVDKLTYNEKDGISYLGNENNPYVVAVSSTKAAVANVEIPNTVKVIYAYAFSECTNLKSIVIPDSVVSIGNNAFDSCKGLESVVFGTGLTRIEPDAFTNCGNLISVTFKDTTTWYTTNGNKDDIPENMSSNINESERNGTDFRVFYTSKIWYKK